MKTAIITQARMTSTRLPGKVLKQAGGLPLLHYHILRLQKAGVPIIIATTTNETDDPIIEFAKLHDYPYFRGDEDNVLSRYYDCAVAFELDTIIRVTSDCPLIDGDLIREGIHIYHKADRQDLYLSNGMKPTFPRGFDFEIFSFQLLEEAFNNASSKPEFEHVTWYIYNNPDSTATFHHFTQEKDYSHFRITVDTHKDFELIVRLIEDYDAAELTYQEITEILELHPELVHINAHIQQKKV